MPSPLDELRLSDDDKRRLYETWPAAMAACMSEQGYDMEIASSDATAGSRMLVRTPIDTVVVAEYGYHLPPEAALPDVVGANERRAQEDPAFMAALFGSDESSTDGCRGEQFDRVYDEDGDFWRLDLQIGNAQVELSIALDASQEMQSSSRRSGRRACVIVVSPTRPRTGRRVCTQARRR